MGKFMKDSFVSIKSMGLAANFMKMEIFTLEIFLKTKSMERDVFAGLEDTRTPATKMLSVRFTMDPGGEDFQMDKATINTPMV